MVRSLADRTFQLSRELRGRVALGLDAEHRAEGPGAELLCRPRELALPGLDPEVLGPELDESRAVRLLPRLVEIPKLILNRGCLSIAFFLLNFPEETKNKLLP